MASVPASSLRVPGDCMWIKVGKGAIKWTRLSCCVLPSHGATLLNENEVHDLEQGLKPVRRQQFVLVAPDRDAPAIDRVAELA